MLSYERIRPFNRHFQAHGKTLRQFALIASAWASIAMGLSGCVSQCTRGETPPAPVPQGGSMSSENPKLNVETTLGSFEIELFADKAPISTENFLKYADDGFYNGTIFHRVIESFMIQGGGFTENMEQKPTRDQIKNEATNGLKNDRGTLAMARTQIVDSATAQFFINVKDNPFLNHTAPNPQGYGYAVFGRVTSGMDIVDQIRAVDTTSKGMYDDVPVTSVLIKSIKRK